jgi:asparagine synthase (glutamine-hydrolysing)
LARIFPEAPSLPEDFDMFDYAGWQPDRTAQWLRWNEFVGHLTMVLLKVDRASMFNSLEVRVPLLDKDLIDVACRVDWQSCLDLKTGIGKLPLRRSLSRHVRHQATAKRGFSVPMDEWLRGPFRPVFEDVLLTRKEFLGQAYDSNAAREMFQKHLTGQADYAWGLWLLLSLALWENQHYKAEKRILCEY